MDTFRKLAISGTTAMLALGALTPTTQAMAAPSGVNQSAQAAQAAAKSNCDEDAWDWDVNKLYPGEKKYNPEYKSAKLQMYQKHVKYEKTYAVLKVREPGYRVSIEKRKGQYGNKVKQVCGPKTVKKVNSKGNIHYSAMTGVLDNENASVRGCIHPPKKKKKCGGWLREDAGGHRQNGGGDGKINNNILHVGYYKKCRKQGNCKKRVYAKANYDDSKFVFSKGGDPVGKKYNIKYGKTTRVNLIRKSDGGAYAWAITGGEGVKITLRSDRYGQAPWVKVNDTGTWGDGMYEGRSGVLYNPHDALQVCVMGPSKKVKCGKWHKES